MSYLFLSFMCRKEKFHRVVLKKMHVVFVTAKPIATSEQFPSAFRLKKNENKRHGQS